MEKYIYVNYAYEDQQMAMPVIEALKDRGIPLKYGNGNEEKLKDSCFVLHLCTPASHTSHTYRKMMNFTLKHEKDMTVLRIADGGFESDIDLLQDVMLQLLKYHYVNGQTKPAAETHDAEAPVVQKAEAPAPAEAELEIVEIKAEEVPAAEAPAAETPAAETPAAEAPAAFVPVPDELPDREELYARGLELLKDTEDEKAPEKAFNSFWQAANRGHINAQYQLSICYAQGIGVRRSISEAARYLEMAAYGGHIGAQAELGYCYETGYGVVRNMPEAIRWYRIAADQGSRDAKNNLAFCYQKGKGVAKDVRQAIHYYEEAASAGHASAQFNLGFIYWYGEGVQTDRGRAITLFEAAEKGGNLRAREMMKVIRQLGYLRDQS